MSVFSCKRVRKGTLLLQDHVLVDTLDAIEIAEVLGYLLERLDPGLPEAAVLSGTEGVTYGYNELRMDVERLIRRLHTAPYWPKIGP